MRSTTRLASIALAATLVVAACGSDETDTGVGGPSGTAAASDTSTPDTVVDTTIATPRPTPPRPRRLPRSRARTSRPTPRLRRPR
jgi:ABC-type glycerol-3-phosphate transport system substrate-binding protein